MHLPPPKLQVVETVGQSQRSESTNILARSTLPVALAIGVSAGTGLFYIFSQLAKTVKIAGVSQEELRKINQERTANFVISGAIIGGIVTIARRYAEQLKED